MVEIRFHGRGGQGAVVASELLASALFKEKRYVQTFPEFGVERRGAPVQAFLRFAKTPIRIRYKVYEPDHIIVLDRVLMNQVPVLDGIKKGGWVIINSVLPPDSYKLDGHLIATCDATAIAIKYKLGPKSMPVVNTAMLGALLRVLPIVTPDSLEFAMKNYFDGKADPNILAFCEAYNETKLQGNESAGVPSECDIIRDNLTK